MLVCFTPCVSHFSGTVLNNNRSFYPWSILWPYKEIWLEKTSSGYFKIFLEIYGLYIRGKIRSVVIHFWSCCWSVKKRISRCLGFVNTAMVLHPPFIWSPPGTSGTLSVDGAGNWWSRRQVMQQEVRCISINAEWGQYYIHANTSAPVNIGMNITSNKDF